MLLRNIAAFVKKDPENKLPDGTTIFVAPLLGFAPASDPIFEEFCIETVIGPLFRHPQQWLAEAYTVISYFLPFSEAVRHSNYGDLPTSVTWLHSRFLGEQFNEKLRRFLLTELQDMGGKAVSPGLHQDYRADYQHFTSNWSERHIAYAAGLGSFGLSRGLITEKGMAGRFGSVITDLQFPATTRSSDNPFQNCPFLADQSCGVCIDRCPSGAITAQGKNKFACYKYTRVEDHLKALREKFGYEHSICGKCQVEVPCENSIP
jgi:epoxyqueuosine reductase QueG